MDVIYQKSNKIEIIYNNDYYYHHRKCKLKKSMLKGGGNKKVVGINNSIQCDNFDDYGEVFEIEL